ncbi:MAG: hypothetical protein KGL39_08190 [Patescibacteria group bacterium]|nr:hypothetical protein [Patescibacteria group bacterium]
MPDEPLTEADVAKRLGISVDSLNRLIATAEFSAGIPVTERTRVWLEMDVLAYLHLKGRILERKPTKEGKKSEEPAPR